MTNKWLIAVLATAVIACACETDKKQGAGKDPELDTEITKAVSLEGNTLDIKCGEEILTTVLADNCTNAVCEWSVKGVPDGIVFERKGDYITFTGKLAAEKCEAGSPEKYVVEIEACDSTDTANCGSAQLIFTVDTAAEEPVKEKSIKVTAKDIKVNCVDTPITVSKEIKAKTSEISAVKWEFNPALSELPAGFEYKAAETVVKITGKLDLEQCRTLADAPFEMTAKACDAEEPAICDSAKFTISGDMKDVMDALAIVQLFTYTLPEIDTSKENKEQKADDVAPQETIPEECKKIEIEEVPYNASKTKDSVTGTEAHEYGDVIYFRFKDIKDKYSITNNSSSVSRGDGVGYTNDTWRMVNDDQKYRDKKINAKNADVLAIGALVYRHEGKNLGKISKKPFKETLTFNFSPIPKGPCGSVPQGPMEVKITVNPPSIEKIPVSDINIIRVMLYNQYLDRHGKTDNSSFTLQFDTDDKWGAREIEEFSTTAKRLHAYGPKDEDDEYDHIEYDEDDLYFEGTVSGLLSQIKRVNIRYYDEEYGADWQANLDYIYLSSPYVYWFAGYKKDYHNQVDGAKGRNAAKEAIESRNFPIKDFPWQLRCDPELPEGYRDLSATHGFNLPAASDSYTCDEEAGDKNDRCKMTQDGTC